jgi:hypothetical protein
MVARAATRSSAALGNDVIRGGGGDDDIDGRGGVDQMYGDAGNDLIHWDYADLVLGTVDGGAGTDILEVVGTSGADDFLIASLGSSSFKLGNTKAGKVVGSLTAKNCRGPAAGCPRRRRPHHAGLHGRLGPELHRAVRRQERRAHRHRVRQRPGKRPADRAAALQLSPTTTRPTRSRSWVTTATATP